MKSDKFSETAQYWFRVLGALALIKVASALVRDAEKLITANMKARSPEIADELNVTHRDAVKYEYEPPAMANGVGPTQFGTDEGDDAESETEHASEN